MKGFRGGAGALRHRIDILERPDPETVSLSGAPSEDWPIERANIPAAYELLGSKEFPEAQKRFSETTVRFRIRYRDGLGPGTHRITFVHDQVAATSRTFDIHGAEDPTGDRVELEIEASEVK